MNFTAEYEAVRTHLTFDGNKPLADHPEKSIPLALSLGYYDLAESLQESTQWNFDNRWERLVYDDIYSMCKSHNIIQALNWIVKFDKSIKDERSVFHIAMALQYNHPLAFDWIKQTIPELKVVPGFASNVKNTTLETWKAFHQCYSMDTKLALQALRHIERKDVLRWFHSMFFCHAKMEMSQLGTDYLMYLLRFEFELLKKVVKKDCIDLCSWMLERFHKEVQELTDDQICEVVTCCLTHDMFVLIVKYFKLDVNFIKTHEELLKWVDHNNADFILKTFKVDDELTSMLLQYSCTKTQIFLKCELKLLPDEVIASIRQHLYYCNEIVVCTHFAPVLRELSTDLLPVLLREEMVDKESITKEARISLRCGDFERFKLLQSALSDTSFLGADDMVEDLSLEIVKYMVDELKINVPLKKCNVETQLWLYQQGHVTETEVLDYYSKKGRGDIWNCTPRLLVSVMREFPIDVDNFTSFDYFQLCKCGDRNMEVVEALTGRFSLFIPPANALDMVRRCLKKGYGRMLTWLYERYTFSVEEIYTMIPLPLQSRVFLDKYVPEVRDMDKTVALFCMNGEFDEEAFLTNWSSFPLPILKWASKTWNFDLIDNFLERWRADFTNKMQTLDSATKLWLTQNVFPPKTFQELGDAKMKTNINLDDLKNFFIEVGQMQGLSGEEKRQREEELVKYFIVNFSA